MISGNHVSAQGGVVSVALARSLYRRYAVLAFAPSFVSTYSVAARRPSLISQLAALRIRENAPAWEIPYMGVTKGLFL